MKKIGIVGSVLISIVLVNAQEFVPAAPSDRTAIYILADENKLLALPFEQGQTPLRPNEVAKRTKSSYIELKGNRAATIATSDVPRIFLFAVEQQGKHPPFLVYLNAHGGTRRVTALSQKGLSGFAIDSAQIIKPTIRVLSREGDQVFVELRPRASLIPAEYAIIGDDLTRIATFRVAANPSR